MKRLFCLIVLFLLFLSSPKPAFAATGPDYWEGNSSVNFGDTPDNWTDVSTNNPPVTGDSLVFDAAGVSGTTLKNNLTSHTFSGITFDPDASLYTINGNSIALTGNIADNSSNNETLNIGISSGTVTNSGTGSGSIIMSGDIGPGVTTVTQDSSTSSLILSGTNSYSGATTVTNGILNIQSNGALAGSGATIASGATLQMEGGITTADVPLTLNGTGVSSDGALENFSGNNTYAGSITLAGVAQINSVLGTLILSGGINGAGYDLIVGGAGNITINSAITGTGSSLTQEGTGTLTLNGTNTYTGATTVSSGILNIQSNGALSGSGVTVASGATLQLQGGITTSAIALTLNGTGVSSNGALENISGNNTYAGLIILNSDSQINSDSGTLTLSGGINGDGNDLIVGGASNTTINSNITGSGTILTEEGTGTLILTGTNTFTGGVNFNGGTVNATSLSNLGSGDLSFDGGTLQFGGVFDPSSLTMTFTGDAAFDTDGQNIIFNNAVGNNGAGGLTKIGLGTLTFLGANTYTGITTISVGTLQIGNGGSTGSLGTGNVVDNANLTFDLSNNPTVSNAISGTGAVTQIGTGTVSLSGANTYLGPTTVSDGTLEAAVIDQAFGVGSAVSVGTGATLDLGGFNETIGSLAGDAGATVTNSGGNPAILTTGDSSSTTFSGNIDDGSSTIGLNKVGSGTLILSGTNAYSGGTTLSGGTLNLDSANAIGSGTITFAGGTLQYTNTSATNSIDYSSQFSVTAADQAFNIDTNGQNITYNNSLTSNGGGSLSKFGLGTLTINASSSYTGTTTIDGGTLQTAAAGAIPAVSDVSIANGAVLDLDGNSATIGSLAGAGTLTSSTGGSMALIAGDSNSTTFSGTIQDGSGSGSGTISFETAGNGTLILSGDNAYSGGTEVVSGSTLQVENANALGSGPVTNEGTLNLGTTDLSIGGTYTQSTGSTLGITLDSSSIYGKITTAVAASVAAGSSVNVNVAYFIPNNTTFDILDTQGAGITGGSPSTVTSNSSVISFSSSISNNNLVLTADNTGFVPLANNANARAVAEALDNIANPTSDMSNVLGTLVVQSDAKISAALNSMGPIVDGGVIQDSVFSLNNFIGATLDRIQNVLSRTNAVNDSLDKAENTLNGNPSSSAVILDDVSGSNGIWAKPYGGYLTQGTLQGIQGYNAWNAGTVVGYDRMITDDFTIGISGGYAYGQVNSDVNDANTDITNAQGTLYAGYQNPDLNYFINAAGYFSWNTYDGQRDITVGPISRVADSNYDGQQYGAYLGGGYKLKLGGNVNFTPLASVQWTHLSLDSYTETNAGALDLNVDSQSYDILESGLGASISYPVEYDWGYFTPELHAKWLYDFINDNMSVTSAFTGGGPSFTSNGAKPGKEGADIGGKLSFDLRNNISLIAEVDTELKNEFLGVYGSGTVRYKF